MKSAINLNNIIDDYKTQVFVIGTSNYTYVSFFNRIQTISKQLESLGVKRGEVVILHDLDLEETVFLLFAIISLQAVALPVNPKTTISALKNIEKAAHAKHIISNSLAPVTGINAAEIFKNAFTQKTANPGIEWDYQAPAVIILTSGSSGEPKMAVHSLNSLLHSAKMVDTYFKLRPTDSWMLSLPLYHVSGLGIVFRCLINKSKLAIPPPKMKLSESLGQFKPTHISLVAVQMQRLLNERLTIDNLRKCRAIFLGGSSIPHSLIKKCLQNGLKIYTSYGLTEMASTVAIKKITGYTTDNAEILPSCQVKINKENEILIKGEALFLGYFEKDVLNRCIDKDGWFYTGDLGSIETNTITVKGRKDNMFISGGENIFPEEIEKHLLMIDGIENAVVIAVKNDEFGQRPLAFVMMNSKMKTEEVIKDLKKTLPSYKIPDRFIPWPADYKEEDIKLKRQYFKTLI
jgi:o-succinylbenzoate---CoA ligase